MKRDYAGVEERSSAAPTGRQPSQNAEQRRPVIGVIGDGQPGSERERMAAEVGGELARAGVHLVCGGLGGCMEGASRGYKEANGEGICLGLLPGMSRAEANPWVDLAIPTGVNSAQGALVAMAVDAAIVLGGGGGTLSEVGLLLRDGKPVVALDGTGGAAEMVGGHQLGKVRVLLAHDPAEAVRLVLEALRNKHPERAVEIGEPGTGRR
ncbi:MAG: TIGR00725 family protein [Deltaproteobacteria bacterium]|nr:MAG: TIGR00725 family protein [Deltaproteobacteria bacterium]